MKKSDLVKIYLNSEFGDKVNDLSADLIEFENILKGVLNDDEIALFYLETIKSEIPNKKAKEFIEFYKKYKESKKVLSDKFYEEEEEDEDDHPYH